MKGEKMEILKKFAQEAKGMNGSIIFAEGDEERTLEAAVKLADDKICKVFIVGSKKEDINKIAQKNKLDLSELNILIPDEKQIDETVRNDFISRVMKKGASSDQAKEQLLDPLNFSALYVQSGKATGCVAGARSSTPDVLRAAIYAIGSKPGTKYISSFFLMVPPDNHPIIKKPIIYSDCGVNPDPGALGLRDIAIASVNSFKSLFPDEIPKIAFLSFSTKGSAEHKILNKVLEAVKITKEYFKDDKSVFIDGEFQFDAAVIPSVATKKASDSPIKGDANIFIFPDLNAGNICYKVTERLGCFTAIGPIIQGLAKPMNDLSRGCSVDDIYYAAVIALLQSR